MSKKIINLNLLKTVKLGVDSIPTVAEDKNKEYVKFGKNNDYLAILNELFNSSALHNAIVRSKVELICGNDFVYDTNNTELVRLINTPNTNNDETLFDIYKKFTNDYELYGNAALQIIWDRTGTKIAEIYSIDFNTLRSGKCDENGKVQYMYYSPVWGPYTRNYDSIKTFDSTVSKEYPTQLIVLKRPTPGMFYYGLPDYQGCLSWIQVESEISNFHLNNLKNGMIPGFSITFPNGEPTKQQQDEIYNSIQEFFSGTSNAGKCLVNFVDDITKAPVIVPLSSNDLGDQFIPLNEATTQAILSGHRINPILAGIQTPGKLGSSSDYEDALKVFNVKTIQPERTTLLKPFNKILKVNGLPEISIAQTEIKFN